MELRIEILNDKRKVFGTKVVKFASLSFFPLQIDWLPYQALESDWLFCCNAALISREKCDLEQKNREICE